MSDPIDALEFQLLQAGHRLQRSRLTNWRIQFSRRAELTAVAIVALFVVTPAVAAVTHTWPGDVDRGTPEAPRIQIPTSDAGLDATLRDAFSVLKRDQTKADELSTNATLPPIVRGVQLDSSRRLLQTPQGGVYLVAVDAILPEPLQVLPPDQRVGPPGICAALTADAPTVFSCAPTRQLLGPGAGLSLQTAICVPGAAADTISLQGLAVDQVSNVEARLVDGSTRSVAIRSNLIDAQFARDNPPRRVSWTFNGTPTERDVLTPSQPAPCAARSTP